MYASSLAAEPIPTPYVAIKFCMERAAGRFKDTLGMRFHTVYTMTSPKGMFMQKLLDGELKWINHHPRDFIHMDDLIDAIMLLINPNILGLLILVLAN